MATDNREVKRTVQKPRQTPGSVDKYKGAKPNGVSEYNRQTVSAILEVNNWSPINIYDPVQFDQRCIDYFTYCINQNRKPTEAGLSLALGISSNEFRQWYKVSSNYNIKQHQSAMRAHQMLEALAEQYLLDNEVYPASMIFYLKNNYGYVDEKKEIVQTDKGTDNYNEKSRQEILASYAEEMKALNIKDADFTVIDNDENSDK